MNIKIIGATSGIGKELWKLYAVENNHVAVTGRRKNLLEQYAKVQLLINNLKYSKL